MQQSLLGRQLFNVQSVALAGLRQESAAKKEPKHLSRFAHMGYHSIVDSNYH